MGFWGVGGAVAGHRINVGSGISGGSMTMTQERAPMGRGRPIVPRPPRPTGPNTTIGRLGNAIQSLQPDTRPPVQQQIRDSKYLKNVETQMASQNERMRGHEGEYIDDPTTSLLSASTSRPKSKKVSESLLSSIGSKIKKTYKR